MLFDMRTNGGYAWIRCDELRMRSTPIEGSASAITFVHGIDVAGCSSNNVECIASNGACICKHLIASKESVRPCQEARR